MTSSSADVTASDAESSSWLPESCSSETASESVQRPVQPAKVEAVTLVLTVQPGNAISDVKSSRPRCPRDQNFVLGLGLEDLSSASDSASSFCPRPVLELFILAS